MDLQHAAHMNVILPRLLEELRHDGHPVVEHSAASTAAGRRLCAVEKSHHADAALTGCPTALRYLPNAPIAIKAVGRGQYQRVMPDQHGTPRGRPFRHYSRLPRHIQRTLPTPGHRKRAKQVDGVATGDYIRFDHKTAGPTHGYGAINNAQVRVLAPEWRSTAANKATVVERAHGYQVSYP